MSFLWPLAWALSALALPVIALYLIRTRLLRRPVSTLLFWEHLAAQVYNQSLWRKLRRWVSLALQLLFLLLLVFAISQPLASWQSAKPSALIVVLDGSVTMKASDVSPSRWLDAVGRVEQRIGHMRIADEAILILAGETPRVLCPWTRNKRSLGRALHDATPGNSVSDMPAALALASNLANQRSQADIVLVSDNVWPTKPAPESLQLVQSSRVGTNDPVNAGLSLFSARRSPSAPGQYQLLARVSASVSMTAELEVRRDGALIDVQSLKLEPGKPWQKSWDGTANGPARFEAHLTGMKRDDFAEDNAAETSLAALHPVDVEVVAPPHPFLDAALDSLPLVNVHRTWPAETLKLPADPSKLYLFYRALPPEGFQPGAILVVNPNADGIWGKYNGSLDSALVSDMQRDEPVLRFVSLENVRLDKVADFTPSAGASIFAKCLGTSDAADPEGKPLLFGQWKASAPRWLVQSFGLEDSDLVYRTAFPVLLGNLIQSLQPDNSDSSRALPGPVATGMKAIALEEKKSQETPPAVYPAGWGSLPLWWWAVGLGLLWLVAEWALFNRRITE